MKHIYLDYNATTPLKPPVYEGMLPYLKDAFGNPSSIHWAGRRAKEATMVARERVARLFHVDPDEVVFTSGGTEANNLALKGAFQRLKDKGRHIITTVVEHKSILDCCDYLRSQGAEISYLSVNEKGMIDLEELKSLIRPDTILVSIQASNNETGVRMPLQDIGKIVKEKKILFHTDAIQMAGKLPLYLNEMAADMVSISAHKMNGPKGVGALILRQGTKLETQIHGGNQERKRRGGTENVPGIVGFGLACDLVLNEGLDQAENFRNLRDRLEEGIVDNIPNCHIYGREVRRITNTLNIGFDGVEGESLLLNLDLQGVAASAGSACSSGSLDPSHVLLAMGCTEAQALAAIRFSVGYQTTRHDIDKVVTILTKIVFDLREEAEK